MPRSALVWLTRPVRGEFCGVAGLDALLDGHAVLHGQGGTLRVTCHPIVARANARMQFDRTSRHDRDSVRFRRVAAARRTPSVSVPDQTPHAKPHSLHSVLIVDSDETLRNGSCPPCAGRCTPERPF